MVYSWLSTQKPAVSFKETAGFPSAIPLFLTRYGRKSSFPSVASSSSSPKRRSISGSAPCGESPVTGTIRKPRTSPLGPLTGYRIGRSPVPNSARLQAAVSAHPLPGEIQRGMTAASHRPAALCLAILPSTAPVHRVILSFL
ncbi:hypothetical protein [Paenibacillus zanthoxyli]|uniref:hypothetical protein n=1 Tax=Paenibacillus zanthoxyli TaxID=369399 RepID=UPI0012EB18C4|nr:hypothetical protein [Paenibacillus zanthoxyli]